MSKRLVAAFTSFMAMALLAAGCGGGDSSPTKAEFVEEANAICAKRVKQIGSALQAGSKKGASPDASVKALLSNLRKEVKELEALDIPAGDEQKIEKMLQYMHKGVEEAEAPDDTILFALGNQLAKGQKMAGAYGLEHCGSYV